jgi:hypothetical protein
LLQSSNSFSQRSCIQSRPRSLTTFPCHDRDLITLTFSLPLAMAYYDENGGDSFGGRFNKNFDGPVGPRRPSTLYLDLESSLAVSAVRLTLRFKYRIGDRLWLVDGTMDANAKAALSRRAPNGDRATERKFRRRCEYCAIPAQRHRLAAASSD